MSDKNIQIGPFSAGTRRNRNVVKSANETTIKTFSFKMEGADVKLDHKARRKNKTPNRRAMVHDFNDGLTLNWTKDYPGGVTINGTVKCPDKLVVKNKDVLRMITELQKKVTDLEKLYQMIDWGASK
ncbi:MAG: hypothetical protein EVB11_09105 [Winogradskyella sp.]|nr:MAG: hypothetical protein EVB11_09105 [Winogradskyella sp.]